MFVKTKAVNLDTLVYEGYRSLLRAAQLFEQGRPLPWAKDSRRIVTRSFPEASMHVYGLAVDIVFDTDKPWDESHPWDELGKIGQSVGLTWGGTFRGFPDRPHFEFNLPSQAIDIKQLYKDGGLVRVWSELDKYHADNKL